MIIRLHQKEKALARWTNVTVLIFASFYAGWESNDIAARSTADMITNLHFVRQQSSDRWLVETASRGSYDQKFCPDYLPQITPGATAEFMKFKQTPDCIEVGGPHYGFKFYRHPNGQPIITEGVIYGQGTGTREEASAERRLSGQPASGSRPYPAAATAP